MKQIHFEIDEKLAEKFEIALKLSGDDPNRLAEEFIRSYLGKAFSEAADSFRGPVQRGNASHQTVPQQTRVQRDTAQQSPFRTKPDHQRPPRPDYWSEWGKAIHRIPRWARNPQQNNHKILKAFLELQREIGRVTIDSLRRRCSDPVQHPETYVPHFDNNYAQMKFDNGNSHGKVFEEKDGYVTIWDRISDTLQRYRDYFL